MTSYIQTTTALVEGLADLAEIEAGRRVIASAVARDGDARQYFFRRRASTSSSSPVG